MTSTIENTIEKVKSLLSNFQTRDIEGFLQYFCQDATVHFIGKDYCGLDKIRIWLQERFDANLRILKIRNVEQHSNRVVVKADIDSDRIRVWPASGITGVMIIEFEHDLIKDLSFGLTLLRRG